MRAWGTLERHETSTLPFNYRTQPQSDGSIARPFQHFLEPRQRLLPAGFVVSGLP
jgi:hypothetical protein